MDRLRAAVSKKKVRYTSDGFDLDLTYITPRMIALGAPTEGGEALYRNALSEVQRFLGSRHAGRFRIYDLRAEKGARYDPARFGGPRHSTAYRFFDHNPSPLETIRAACEDMQRWLGEHPENVVAVHCKAGKGRTGMMLSALLLQCGAAPTATEAIALFGRARTTDGKGITIPSQMRYVHYYEALLRAPAPAAFAPAAYRLRHIRLHTVPNFDLHGGCDPFFDVRVGDGRSQVFNWLTANGKRVPHYQPKSTQYIDLDVSQFDVRVKGDVKIIFYDYDLLSEPDKMFHFWFNVRKQHLLTYADREAAMRAPALVEFLRRS